jgi:hypothetical protein
MMMRGHLFQLTTSPTISQYRHLWKSLNPNLLHQYQKWYLKRWSHHCLANGQLATVPALGACVTTRLTSKPRHLSKSTSLRGSEFLLILVTGFLFHLPGQVQELGFRRDYNTWASLHQKFLSRFLAASGPSDHIFDGSFGMGQEILAPLTNFFHLLMFPCFFVWKCRAILCSFCCLVGIRFTRFCNNNPAAYVESSRFSHLGLVYRGIHLLFNESNFSCQFVIFLI